MTLRLSSGEQTKLFLMSKTWTDTRTVVFYFQSKISFTQSSEKDDLQLRINIYVCQPTVAFKMSPIHDSDSDSDSKVCQGN